MKVKEKKKKVVVLCSRLPQNVKLGIRELKHQTLLIHERHGWPRRTGSGTRFACQMQSLNKTTWNYHERGQNSSVENAFQRFALKGLCSAVQFILFNFANYSSSIAMELKVSKEITCKWQSQRFETNKYVSWALFLKLQAAGINFEKLLGWTVFKNPNFNPFQSSSVLPIRDICCFLLSYFNLPLTF